MLLLNASANRDESSVPVIQTATTSTARGGHLSFGQGLHFCLGSCAGPAGSAGGVRRGAQTLARLGSRLPQRPTSAHRKRARVGTLTGHHRSDPPASVKLVSRSRSKVKLASRSSRLRSALVHQNRPVGLVPEGLSAISRPGPSAGRSGPTRRGRRMDVVVGARDHPVPIAPGLS